MSDDEGPIDLWLDDIRRPLIGYVHAKTAAEAKDLLRTGRVRFASLDHDLDMSASIGQEPTKETGYDLVKWMIATGHWPKRKPLVHSANPAGRQAMQIAIERWWGKPAQDSEGEP